MKIICIIPARSGSKGLRDKNILKLNKRPLIYWPIKIAKQVKEIDYIVLSTDSSKYAKMALKYGASVPFIRPKKISNDTSTTESTLKYTLEKTEKKLNLRFDLCVFLTCTDIFRDPSWIKKGINILKKNKNIESCFAANPTAKNYWKKTNGKWKRILKNMRQYSNRQTKEKIYREDTGLTCITRTNLIRKGKRIGDNVELIINDRDETVIDIHTKFDLFLAEQSIKFFKKYDKEKYSFFQE